MVEVDDETEMEEVTVLVVVCFDLVAAMLDEF